MAREIRILGSRVDPASEMVWLEVEFVATDAAGVPIEHTRQTHETIIELSDLEPHEHPIDWRTLFALVRELRSRGRSWPQIRSQVFRF